jgi:hypothetical protein
MFGISAYAQAPYASLGTSDITIALTGVVASGVVGTVSRGATSIALTGVQAVGSAGTVVAIYWVLVNNSQTSNWALVDNSETSNWVLVNTP